jgi:hypothetical protein
MERQKSSPKDRLDCYLSLISKSQLDGFKNWLEHEVKKKTQVIFIASGSPIAPISRDQQQEPYLLEGGDTLLGYPGFLRQVADLLVEFAKDKYVCWLSGDAHLSCYANLELKVSNGKSARLTQVCSSAVYAPLSFINTKEADCDWNGSHKLNRVKCGLQIDYQQYFITDHQQHFVRLDLMTKENQDPVLNIRAYGYQKPKGNHSIKDVDFEIICSREVCLETVAE